MLRLSLKNCNMTDSFKNAIILKTFLVLNSIFFSRCMLCKRIFFLNMPTYLPTNLSSVISLGRITSNHHIFKHGLKKLAKIKSIRSVLIFSSYYLSSKHGDILVADHTMTCVPVSNSELKMVESVSKIKKADGGTEIYRF